MQPTTFKIPKLSQLIPALQLKKASAAPKFLWIQLYKFDWLNSSDMTFKSFNLLHKM